MFNRILLTSYGSPDGASIVKALYNSVDTDIIIKVDVDEDVAYIDYVVPVAEDIGYIDAVNHICDEEDINIIFPCNIREAYCLSSNQDRLKADVVVNHPTILENCITKNYYNMFPEYTPYCGRYENRIKNVKEFCIDVLCWEGKAFIVIPREILKTKNGIVFDTVIKKNDDLILMAENIVAKMGLSYAINIQVMKTVLNDNFKILKVNPISTGNMCASYYAGVNMFDLAIKLRQGREIPKTWDINWGTRVRRSFKDIVTQENRIRK